MKENKIWVAIALKRVWVLGDGSHATEAQADAIAMGFIKGGSHTTGEQVWAYGPCTRKQGERAYRNWASTSPVYHRHDFESIEFREGNTSLVKG